VSVPCRNYEFQVSCFMRCLRRAKLFSIFHQMTRYVMQIFTISWLFTIITCLSQRVGYNLILEFHSSPSNFTFLQQLKITTYKYKLKTGSPSRGSAEKYLKFAAKMPSFHSSLSKYPYNYKYLSNITDRTWQSVQENQLLNNSRILYFLRI